MAQPSARPARRRPARFPRGPFVIGEPAASVEPGLAAGDPYRPDTIVDGGSVFGLTVRAASVRGLGKRFSAGPRQDDLCLRVHEPTRTLIAALADGVSGARRSDLGAALAVRHAAAAVARQLDGGRRELGWEEVFDHAAWALVEEHRRASEQPDAGVEQAAAALSTTLLVAAVRAGEQGEAHAQLALVGDSPALLLRGRRFQPLLGDERPDGSPLIGGSVQALPRGCRAVRSTRCRLHAREVLLLASDGFSLPLAGGESEVGAVFARELARPRAIVDFARLLDFSRATYDDDRTLIAVWPAQSSP